MRGSVVGVDFETYYTGEYSVRTMGVYPYVRDRRFRAWAVAVSDGTRTVVKEPGAFPWAEINGLAWVSHNREFDKAVFLRLQEDGVIPQGVRPGVWHCTAAACAFLQYPRDLKGACKGVLGIEVDKSVRAGLKGQKGADDLFAHSGMTAEEEKYTGNDAELCLKLWTALGWRWPEHERALFEATCEMGARGVPVDWGRVEQARAELTVAARKLEAGIEWTPALSVDKFKKSCAAYGVPAPASTGKGDANFGEWLKMYGNTPCGRMAANMASLRRTNRLVKLLETMGTRRKPDGRMAFELKYYGATPGRWSGGGGFNVQNLNRKEVAGLDIRSCFCAGAGEVFGVADYSQIEARVLLWLAGDEKTLTMLRENPAMDMYEVHARATMGYREEEPLEKYCERTGALTRQLAKARVLGLGFRCGAGTFVRVAKIMAGLDIGFDEAKRIVREYRDSNPLVVTLWEDLERQAWEAFDKGDDLVIPFPATEYDPRCGRHLYYRDLRVSAADAEWFGRGGKVLTAVVAGERVPIHGGILAENLVQGTARDVMASAWLRCRKAGYLPCLTVHDELVFELPEATAEGKLAEIRGIMEAPLPWAPGLPLRTSGKLMKRYGK
jgi:DNA polymerase